MTIYNCECNASCPYEDELPETITDERWEELRKSLNEDRNIIFIIHRSCLELAENKNRYDIVKEDGELVACRWNKEIQKSLMIS